MSLSKLSLLRLSPALADEALARPSRAISARGPRCASLLWTLVAAVLGVATPGAALAEGETDAVTPAQPSAAAAANSAGTGDQQDATETCLENHAQGQEFRLSGKLLEGRDTFLHCSATQCPAQIQRDCLNYLEQIQIQIPSVAFRVSADGVSRADVKVFIDGNLVLEKLSGKAVDLNPGSHELRVVLPPFAPYEQSLVVSEGDKFRVVQVTFTTPAPESPEDAAKRVPMHRPIPLPSYILGGVGVAAAINGLVWALSSNALEQELESTCAPDCEQESVDVLRQRALVADISWGVTAASLTAAGIFYLLRPEVPVEGSVQVGVAWLNEGGAIGTVSVPTF
jgi:hypothetical protein